VCESERDDVVCHADVPYVTLRHRRCNVLDERRSSYDLIALYKCVCYRNYDDGLGVACDSGLSLTTRYDIR